VRFYGTDFYSYRTVIARYMTNQHGQQYVLAATHRRYSISTERHLSVALSQVGNVPIYRVPHLAADVDNQKINALHLYNEVLSFRDMAVRRWKDEYGHYAIDEWPSYLRSMWENCAGYVSITGISFDMLPLAELMTQIRTTRELKRAEWNEPSSVRRRERAKARREAVLALNLA